MGMFKRAWTALNEPKESKRFIIRWDCPHCDAFFRTPEQADRHIAAEHG